MDRVRLALCDEVGLGKTITAGAILSELKARQRIRRVLVVAPKGVQLQWVAELIERFGEELVRVGPEGVPVDAGIDPWRAFDQVICSFDSVKPIRVRAGWEPQRVDDYNGLRFRAIVEAGWDLVIFDEAHHVAGSSDEVSRHRLARELASVANHCLLLSATPHSGKTDGFRRFLSLLDESFRHGAPLTRETVQPLIARAEKRTARDNAGRPLFTERTTSLEVVPYGDRGIELKLYEAVTDYVREGYGRSLQARRPAVSFLVLLMQRLVSSSTAAIRTALEKRAAVLDTQTADQLRLAEHDDDEWRDLTGEEQLDEVLEHVGAGWSAERREVEHLLGIARTAEDAGIDAKAEFFLELMRRLRRDESNPSLKFLVFTEFLPTQQMLLRLLASAGIDAVAVNGGMSLAERALAQQAFRDHAEVLVSTEAGGEGVNLQFAHVVINWDMPWSPTRLEQRIGRVDRIGQRLPVRVFNLVMENSIDQRVLEVLNEKLDTILQEFGADKRGDILETADRATERLYAEAILSQDALADYADRFAASTVESLREQASLRAMLTVETQRPKTNGARLRSALDTASAALTEMTADQPADPVDALIGIPSIVSGEPVPVIRGCRVVGWWSCWEAKPNALEADRTAFAMFVGDDDLPQPHQAEQIWELIVSRTPTIAGVSLLSEPTWKMIERHAADYGYQACAAISSTGVPENPTLRPLLVAKIEP